MKLPRKEFQSLLKRRGELLSKRSDCIEIREKLAAQEYISCRISSTTPQETLLNIIKYENVHKINNLQELHKRTTHGRRIYGLFHPDWIQEPLVFTEIALMNNIATSMEEIFTDSQLEPSVLVFYSINSTQIGLSGLDLAKSLISKVTEALSVELQINTVCTLSPIVGFVEWLKTKESSLPLSREKLLFYAKEYIVYAKRGKYAQDPVANFHSRNGAEFYQVNWDADIDKERSLGMMVNYLYPRDPKSLQENAFNYIETGRIKSS